MTVYTDYGYEPGNSDSDLIERANGWCDHYWNGTFPSGMASDPGPIIAAVNRLEVRSKLLNQILFNLAVAAGFEDKGGRIDATTQEIMDAVLTRLGER